MNSNQYSATITLWKAFWTWVTAMLGVGAGVLAIDAPATYDEFLTAWPALLLPMAFAIAKAFENWRKNAGYNTTPLFRWPWE